MKFLVIVQCFVALAVAAPQGYQYGLPKFSGDASLIGAGSGAHFSSLGGSGSASS
uniref:Secreted protein n=3 Tax=Lutzomyia longipalpis TaxID=7200 RepID=A0A1B0GI78_LUTLO